MFPATYNIFQKTLENDEQPFLSFVLTRSVEGSPEGGLQRTRKQARHEKVNGNFTRNIFNNMFVFYSVWFPFDTLSVVYMSAHVFLILLRDRLATP